MLPVWTSSQTLSSLNRAAQERLLCPKWEIGQHSCSVEKRGSAALNGYGNPFSGRGQECRNRHKARNGIFYRKLRIFADGEREFYRKLSKDHKDGKEVR